MSNSLIPPLVFYSYSPYSMEGTSLNNGKLNNSFFNTYKSVFGPSTNITLNSNPTKFSNDSISSTCNKFSRLFLTNNNDTLSNEIGNLTTKMTFLKLEQLKNIYILNGIAMNNIYDENQFYYGSIIVNVKDQNYSSVMDINGNNTDMILKIKIIYADGYYDYLNTPLIPNIQNEITVEIINGIRTAKIPLDPTGLYIPNFISNSLVGLVPSLYLPSSLNSTFLNTELQMEEYNLTQSLYLNNSLTLNVGEINTLSILNKNIFDNDVYDGLFFNLYSVNNSSPLVESGNILGLTSTHIYQTGSVGYINPSGLRFPIIVIYGDNDFDYLNYNSDPTRFNTFVIEINNNGTYTFYLPSKPKNFVPPTISYPENKILPDKIIYNKFYTKPSNNSSVFDNTVACQNITLFSDIYDSYDEVTGLFGNIIGKVTVFKFILNKNNQIYTGAFVYYNFSNNEYLTSVYVLKNGLDKNGSIVSGVNVKEAIIASSDNYGFNSYFNNVTSFKNYNLSNIGYLLI